MSPVTPCSPNQTGLPAAGSAPGAGRIFSDVQPRTDKPRLRYAAFSPDPFEALGVLLPALHIDVGVAGDRLCGFFIEGAERARRRSHDQRIVRKFLALGHHGAGADEAVL